ncbi:uncharacterized protein LOC122527510 [Frieseomelitta varia]|uniref:uncharacterized protein LOC122527510 n=1 Tax=Frieseomelitta varia TaxID=561572 RepID=UPI001CB6892C|nr:uncharacterized protein LOC122527510 [Frieseomelitta varia]
MTRCNKSEVNLKSTAYNQNGQSYFEQLTAYNSMSLHLRRVLLAKCAVDARNKTYMRRRKQTCKQIDWKPRYVKTEIKNNIIDRLAYDTSYYPADFLRMNSKYYCQHEDQKYFTDPLYDYNEISLRSRLHVACPSSSTFKTNSLEPVISDNKNKRQQSYTRFNRDKKVFNPMSVKTAVKIQDRVEKNSIYYESTCDYLSQNINHLSSEINTSRNYGDYETPQISINLIDSHKTCTEDEETKYAKFMYDITHEIILNGLYTDKELQEVFNKHIEENKTLLDMNRMLYEIYQLKFALNISDTSEEEKLEDLICAQQLLNISEIRPPTPSKVLNENRVLKKLTDYQNLDEIRRDSLSRRKSVLLIDANPELHITERDVLTSLIEADINPKEARKIYRRLSSKSKSLFKPNEEYAMGENIDIFNNSLTESYNVNKVDESKRSSMIDDFITQESKDVQT